MLNDQFPLSANTPSPNFATAASDACLQMGEIPGMSAEDQHRGAQLVFEELHLWASTHVPMGAAMDERSHETLIRTGINAVRNKLSKDPSRAQAYGIDPISLITLISAMFSIVGWIRKWMRGE